MTQTIEQLQARVAELEAELDQADCINGKVIAENGDLKEKIILAQAEIKRLRDALIKEHGMYEGKASVGIGCAVCDLIAQPSDTSSIDSFVAEKVKEATAEFRNAWNNGEWPVTFANEQISTLTRQRDLAVEALDKIGDPWISSVPAIAEFARKVSSTIKESEGE